MCNATIAASAAANPSAALMPEQFNWLGDPLTDAQATTAALSPASWLLGKKILLGVCGSIAAYKAATVVRLLVKAGAEVKVVMTPSATHFVSPLTFSTLSKHAVVTQFTNTADSVWNNHVELGLWADALLVAPATATTIAKMAAANADNVLVATYLSARCPVFVAPAMDLDMWQHPATQRNLRFLINECGNYLIPVGHGELASGLSGDGRLAEPEQIVEYLQQHFAQQGSHAALPSHHQPPQTLLGKTVLITAGPTYEPIDPVRFVGNRSTGKMGIALAEVAAHLGAKVLLLLGDTHLRPQQHANIQLLLTPTAQSMFEAAIQLFPQADIAILSAAVADYTPKHPQANKIKKTGETLKIDLHRTQDILANLGSQKQSHQILVGFALETDNETEHALNKLQRKNLDLIVLNSLRDAGAGFAHDTNKVTIFDKSQQAYHFDLKSKEQVASDIIDLIVRTIPHSN